MTERKYFYSEVFNSIQGEGNYTGVPTLWLRFFLCNLQCNGFGQLDPTNPDTYELPFEDFDVDSVSRVEDLPVWEKGCDSSYTWAKKFKKLMGQKTPRELADLIVETAKTSSNPEGTFRHPVSGQTSHMCFTGGEPLMKTGQMATVEMMKYFIEDGNIPKSVTFETNGTQALTKDFYNYWEDGLHTTTAFPELFFSVSPKLWTVAGETRSKAIKPEVVKEYRRLSPNGQLKFVVGPHQRQWDEMEEVIKLFREHNIDWPVWVMPTGATLEEQEATAGDVAKIAFERGYNVSGRMHVYLFGNAIGT